MSDIDEKIRNALVAEDQKAIDEIDDGAGLFELIGLTFKGKQAWMTYYMYFLGLIVASALVYFVIQYLGAADIKTSLNWALLILGCLFMITLIKILSWQQIQKAELLREIKRLEMRIMLVAEQNSK
ncbi:MAG: hypothetical protein HN872_06100 [Gammaproteobacteria bacterium]|jgi:hypothetical protein|nr:hypothetical protein [Gammaproteobacteria bacterium]MBT7226167.1 hypothetical protein [Gammaproteobacteria bacterium]MDC3267718.1 hypothetical protein [bacterium]